MAEYMYNLGLKTIEDYVNFFMCKGQYNWMRHCADQVLDEMIDLALSKDIKSNIIIFAENAKVSGDKINITTICDKIQHENFKRGWWKVINNKLVLYNQHVVNHDEEKVYKFDSEIDWTKKTSW
ncbi:421_t:CDS:1, partial [Dentiscutata heterogama]